MFCQQYLENNNNNSVTLVAELVETEEVIKTELVEIENFETKSETKEIKEVKEIKSETDSETEKGGVEGACVIVRSSPQECPICMDDIDLKKNCITTECGHIFHCSCLMKNAATNGFSCPMCRTVMAEELPDDDDEDDYSEYDEYEEDEMFDDNALTSFRMFQQQLEGEEVEEEPEQDEDEVEEEEQAEASIVMPTPETVASKLAARGITLEDAVKVLLLAHEEYDEFEEVYDRRAQELYGEIRRIIHISTSTFL